MKFTLSWLKEHLDTSASADEISRALTALGLEVEDVTDKAAALAPFTVAHITAAERHPNAEKLQVCKVQSDAGELQIVCGAANARAGLKVALAKEGALIPKGNFKIKKTAIRGVESNGMLCSEEELGIAGSSEGIIELPQDAQVGEQVAKVLGLDDVVFDIAITPNRADALGVYGIARDLAATGIGTLKPLGNKPHAGKGVSAITVKLDTPDCPAFIGCTIKNVSNRESPAWLKNKLTAIGLRPISALVDITNYFTFAYGRPLHVFDADTLTGNITVRHAKNGETLEALNGKSYELTDGMTVIADDARALALGGIIGGTSSGCSLETKNVFLEVALFNTIAIAKTGRALQIDSDARYRFERGVDASFMRAGAELAASMIVELCGGEASEFVSAGTFDTTREAIAFSPEKVKALGGLDIPPARIKSILQSVGCEVIEAQTWKVTPPSWRQDISMTADLVEEVLRIHGYDNVPALSLPLPEGIASSVLTPAQKRLQTLRHALAGRGMHESHLWSFVSDEEAARFGGQRDGLKLLNPISAELSVMRPNLLPGLLAAYGRNSRRGYDDLALFEIGPSFHDAKPQGQKTIAAGLRAGKAESLSYPDARFNRNARPADAFDAKADALAVLAVYGLQADKIEIKADAPAWYHPGRSGTLTLGGKMVLGRFGELHPAILRAYDIGAPVAAFEIDLSALPQTKAKGKGRSPLAASDFQAVAQDFAFVVDAALPAAELLKAVNKADDALVRDVQLFDVYMGKGVSDGKKSVALQITLQANDRTLSDADINTTRQKIIESVIKHCNAELRA